MYWVAWISSVLASILRLGAGSASAAAGNAPTDPIILYEFEACPFCKIAREQASAIGLTLEMRPCPKNGDRYRPELVERAGKEQFPYMIDPNTDTEMYESGDIARYFRETYSGRRPALHWLGPINIILANFSILIRGLSGQRKAGRKTDRTIDGPELILTGSEWHPSTRLAKEALCSKQVQYIWMTYGNGAPTLKSIDGSMELFGGQDIVRYIATL